MKKIIGLFFTGIALVGCVAEGNPGPSTVRERREQSTHSGARTTEIYAAVIRRLVTKDHTFGSSRSPFDHIYVVDGAVERAGDPMEGDGEPGTPFSRKVKEDLRAELDDLLPVGFVSNPDSVRLGPKGMEGVKDAGAIITLGPVAGQSARVEVANSLWCGGMCGQWLTYVVELRGGDWEVTGTTGSIAIS